MSRSAKQYAHSTDKVATVAWSLHEGECLAGLSSMADGAADVVITDPPYEAEAHTSQRLVARARGKLEVEPLTFPPITEELRTESARQMARLARRWILVFCQVEAAMKWRAALEGGGAVYKRTCLWIKPDGKPQYSGDRPGIGYESIVACHAPGRSTWNGGLFSNPGELILDPFAGSGTTGVAAIRLGRRFLGWEMNADYVAMANKRLASAREQLVFDV